MDESNIPTYIFTLRDKSMRPNATLIKDGLKIYDNNDDVLFAIDLQQFHNLFYNILQESRNMNLVSNEKFDYPAKHNPELMISIEHVRKSPNISRQLFQPVPLQQPLQLTEEIKKDMRKSRRDCMKSVGEKMIKERGWNKSSPKFKKSYLAERGKELERNFNSSGSLHLSDLEPRSPSQLSPIISNPSPLNDIEHLLSPPSIHVNVEPLNNFMEQRRQFITPNRERRLNRQATRQNKQTKQNKLTKQKKK